MIVIEELKEVVVFFKDGWVGRLGDMFCYILGFVFF